MGVYVIPRKRAWWLPGNLDQPDIDSERTKKKHGRGDVLLGMWFSLFDQTTDREESRTHAIMSFFGNFLAIQVDAKPYGDTENSCASNAETDYIQGGYTSVGRGCTGRCCDVALEKRDDRHKWQDMSGGYDTFMNRLEGVDGFREREKKEGKKERKKGEARE